MLFKLQRGRGGQHEKSRYRKYGGLSGVNVITKLKKKRNQTTEFS